MLDLIIILLLAGCYFKANINLEFKNESVWSKNTHKLLFTRVK